MSTLGDRRKVARQKRKVSIIKKLIMMFIFITIISGVIVIPHFITHNYVLTVTNKTIEHSYGRDKYMVYTKSDNGVIYVFENTDSLIEGKNDSGPLYNGLLLNQKYEIETYGVTIPLISCFENITRVSAPN